MAIDQKHSGFAVQCVGTIAGAFARRGFLADDRLFAFAHHAGAFSVA